MSALTLKPPKTWRIVAHHLEHLDSKKLKDREKPPQMVECYGQMNLNLARIIGLKHLYGEKIEAVHGVRLRPSALVALAARRVLTRGEFRLLNGYWDACIENRDEDKIVLYGDVHLGVSYDESIPALINEEKGTVDGPRLCIPTLHNPSMELLPFLSALQDLIRRVHADHESGMLRLKETKLNELMGHTFIFNNIGGLGHTAGGSRLTAHTSAMLNMGVIAPDRTAPFQLFFDHRMFDGSMVTRFLKAIEYELVECVSNEVIELPK